MSWRLGWLWYNKPFHLAISILIRFGASVFLLFVSLVRPLHTVAADAAGNGDFGELVDIGGGRKMYLECRGSGSPTVVLISGEAGAATVWTVADPVKPARMVPWRRLSLRRTKTWIPALGLGAREEGRHRHSIKRVTGADRFEV